MKYISYIHTKLGVALLGASLLTASCTGEFDKWNTDPNSATEEDITHDNLNTGAFFSQMQHNVFIVGLDKGGSFQIVDMLTGGLFSGYFSNIKASYDIGAIHNAHYVMPDKQVVYYGMVATKARKLLKEQNANSFLFHDVTITTPEGKTELLDGFDFSQHKLFMLGLYGNEYKIGIRERS